MMDQNSIDLFLCQIVGPPRFELESQRPERHRMDQATLRAHVVQHTGTNIYVLSWAGADHYYA